MSLAANSPLMRLCYSLGLKRLAWSLRRLHCPVEADALVLEVGSGGNPYARANVLVDAFEETRERHWDPLVHDRPTVLANGEKLPFKDKAFDFVIAAHVLEHTTEPQDFLAELQRVSRAGYIETPDAFMERINPYKDHRLEVTVRDGGLRIRKKAGWVSDPDLVELYENKAKAPVTKELIPRNPEQFHVRYYWSDTIDYRIDNPEVDANWSAEPVVRPAGSEPSLKLRIRQRMLALTRSIFSQSKRNSELDILPLLQCPTCSSESFVGTTDHAHCQSCGSDFSYRNGVLIMASKAAH
jgi:SAM-dependent methyltransferase